LLLLQPVEGARCPQLPPGDNIRMESLHRFLRPLHLVSNVLM
jgi:hypothetical protein